jgi:hypothetical protein
MTKLATIVLLGALALNGCGNACKTERQEKIKDNSIDCDVFTIYNQKVFLVTKTHDRGGIWPRFNWDMEQYWDMGADGKLDMYIEDTFRADRRPVQKIINQYLIVDESDILSYDPSKFLYPPPSPRNTVKRNTKEAQNLQKKFESLKKSCK